MLSMETVMISDEEKAKADAEYAAIPGTPADLTRIADISKVKGSHANAISKVCMPMADGLREQGYTWFRVTAPTDDEDHVYLEAWRERPQKEAPLNRDAVSAEANPDV